MPFRACEQSTCYPLKLSLQIDPWRYCGVSAHRKSALVYLCEGAAHEGFVLALTLQLRVRMRCIDVLVDSVFCVTRPNLLGREWPINAMHCNA